MNAFMRSPSDFLKLYLFIYLGGGVHLSLFPAADSPFKMAFSFVPVLPLLSGFSCCFVCLLFNLPLEFNKAFFEFCF